MMTANSSTKEALKSIATVSGNEIAQSAEQQPVEPVEPQPQPRHRARQKSDLFEQALKRFEQDMYRHIRI